MSIIEIRVFGDPKAQPRVKSRVFFKSGKAISGVYTPSGANGWKEAIAIAAMADHPFPPLAGPLRMDVTFYFARPKRLLRKKDPDGPIWHTDKPDRDNLDKCVLDTLTACGYWHDDRQVCMGTIRKFYAGRTVPAAGAEIVIRTMDNERPSGIIYEQEGNTI